MCAIETQGGGEYALPWARSCAPSGRKTTNFMIQSLKIRGIRGKKLYHLQFEERNKTFLRQFRSIADSRLDVVSL